MSPRASEWGAKDLSLTAVTLEVIGLTLDLALGLILIIAGGIAMDELPKLSHEKLHAYQKSIQFLALSAQITSSLPRGNGELIDQLKRAALSVPWFLNIKVEN